MLQETVKLVFPSLTHPFFSYKIGPFPRVDLSEVSLGRLSVPVYKATLNTLNHSTGEHVAKRTGLFTSTEGTARSLKPSG